MEPETSIYDVIRRSIDEGYNVLAWEISPGHCFIELETDNSYGEDVIIDYNFQHDTTGENLLREAWRYAEDFDEDDYVDMWLQARKHDASVPCASELLRAAQENRATYQQICRTIEAVVRPDAVQGDAMRYTYQAIVEKRCDDLWTVTFPQFSGLTMSADTREGLIKEAAEMLRAEIASRSAKGGELPKQSNAIEVVAISVEPPDEDETQYMTQEEAQEYLGVSHGRISALVRNGQLKGRMFGRRHMVSRASVEAYAKTPRRAGRPPKGASNL